MGVIEELKFLEKITKKKFREGGGESKKKKWGGGVGLGGQGVCERRIKVFCENSKIKIGGGWGVGGGGVGLRGGGGSAWM